MTRKPPAKIIRQLRKEVGFGCPVSGCGNPYLTWHHFDPPWHVKQHHHPSGMVALCWQHHTQADAGAFTHEQLLELKSGRNAAEVKGRLEWMRQRVLAVVGGNFYYETPVILKMAGRPILWFERDKLDYLLLGVALPTVTEQPRIRIQRNIWDRIGRPSDFECPPSGRILRATYEGGDSLSLEFRNVDSSESFQERFGVPFSLNGAPFPHLAVASG